MSKTILDNLWLCVCVWGGGGDYMYIQKSYAWSVREGTMHVGAVMEFYGI